MAKKPLPTLEQLSLDTDKFFDVLNGEPDFSVVLIAGAYLDACLAATLSRYLSASSVTEKILDPRGGALGTYSSRTDLCYALGLVPKSQYQDLTQIGVIRNAFAHRHLGHAFSDSEIAPLCVALNWIDSMVDKGASDPLRLLAPPNNSPRDRFVLTAALLSQTLLVRGLGLQHRNGAT